MLIRVFQPGQGQVALGAIEAAVGLFLKPMGELLGVAAAGVAELAAAGGVQGTGAAEPAPG